MISGQVTVAVVESLEVIQIEHEQRQRALVALRAADFTGQLVVELAVVREPGERIRDGQLPGFLEQAGILDRHGHLAGKRREELDLLRPELVALGHVQVHAPQRPILHDQGHGQERNESAISG